MKKWLLFVLVIVMMFCLVGCGEMAWPDGRLASMIPQIEGAKGEVSYQDIDNLDIQLEDISESQYLNYIEECKSSGFNIEINDKGSSFSAFNKDGYKIEITYFSDGEMWIWVDAPMTMSNFDWPDSAIAKLLPEPDSNYGNILWENEGGFVIYVGNITKEEYKNYVNDVYARGFTVDYERGENYFYADN
ncbi:MAG: hypothetical protein IKC47_04865, partial [Clostridia bacterium]|nr:hypothetical protein [Clostridia bacterium]